MWRNFLGGGLRWVGGGESNCWMVKDLRVKIPRPAPLFMLDEFTLNCN